MSILIMSEKCCKVRVASEVYTRPNSLVFPDIQIHLRLHSMGHIIHWIYFIYLCLMSNWRSLCRVKTCSTSLNTADSLVEYKKLQWVNAKQDKHFSRDMNKQSGLWWMIGGYVFPKFNLSFRHCIIYQVQYKCYSFRKRSVITVKIKGTVLCGR